MTMNDRLTDERLVELERLADEDRRWGVFAHPDYARAAREAVPALIAEVRALRQVAEAATQEAYEQGRRDERERIVRLLQEMYARHYQMARQERDRWVRMAHYDQGRAIEEAIRRIEAEAR